MIGGDDLARRPDPFGEVGGGEAGAGADVEQGLALRETGTAEPTQHLGAPQPVLEAEPRDFVVAGAEEVIAAGYGVGVRRGGGRGVS